MRVPAVIVAALATALPAGAQPAPATASPRPVGAVHAQAADPSPVIRRRVPTQDVVLHNPYVAKDRLAAGWRVVKKASATPEVDACTTPSLAGVAANTYACGTGSTTVACWKRPGSTNVLTCLADPAARTLRELRTRGSIRPSAAASAFDRRPVASVMADGHTCHLRPQAAWGSDDPESRYMDWAACTAAGRATYRLWQLGSGREGERTRARSVQYRAAYVSGTTHPIFWSDARTRYWIA